MEELIGYLYEALASDHGLRLHTSNPERLRAKLYTLRKQDEDFKTLSFVISPTNPGAELWIVKAKPNEERSPESHT